MRAKIVHIVKANCARRVLSQKICPVQEGTLSIQLVKRTISSPGVKLVEDLAEPANVHSLHKPAE